MIDMHMHTARCGHATGSVGDYVAAAADRGLDTIAFTDHLPLPEGYPAGYSMTWDEIPGYVTEVLSAAETSSSHGGPDVLCGIEADFLPGREAEVAAVLAAHPFDVVLGSVHFVDDWAFDDPDLRARYGEWTTDDLWARYFADLAAAARSGLFDVMAHPDLVKKFRCYPDTDPRHLYEAAAEAFADSGVAVEVNTAGLRKPCAEIYPSLAFLAACRRRGVTATVGSDAHAPEEVGAGMDAAREALSAAGYRSVVVFEGRQVREVGL